jgi:hypothetical protein
LGLGDSRFNTREHGRERRAVSDRAYGVVGASGRGMSAAAHRGYAGRSIAGRLHYRLVAWPDLPRTNVRGWRKLSRHAASPTRPCGAKGWSVRASARPEVASFGSPAHFGRGAGMTAEKRCPENAFVASRQNAIALRWIAAHSATLQVGDIMMTSPAPGMLFRASDVENGARTSERSIVWLGHYPTGGGAWPLPSCAGCNARGHPSIGCDIVPLGPTPPPSSALVVDDPAARV